MQKFDFTAPASGAAVVVNAPGRYIKYVLGNAGGNDTGLIVTPGSKPGSKILLYPGQAVTLPEDGTAGPNGWTITNAVGAGTIIGSVVIGNGRIDDNTLQGTVNVVDGGKFRTLSNSAFACAAGAPGAASVYGRNQLWNPAASGVRLVCESVVIKASSTAQSMNIGFMNTQLTGGLVQGVSKLGGGTAAKGGVMADTNASSVQTFTALSVASAQANTLQNIYDIEPLVVPPGWGLTLWSTVANSDLVTNFQWYEEPNV
ncbi:hypothetical protein M3A49_40820 [Paraburkholderia sp. CNPSo 3076]|uniref:hypothetical protein n=1 Tax=Paraburkholderia sp. CNPSo 3076 TaxID=2940936 RepID=UPI002256E406|nr:hypothetical protein [Paraburkholderia sp. CNPSo 3076]MCX5545691.1 hypothetical protein [Paraburkholderia sp. CNPSo 3076]